MTNEEKIIELTERIEKLEKIEKKRKIRRIISIIFKLIKLIIFIVLIVIAYNYIKPYKEKIDNINEKVDKVENYFGNTLDDFKNYFK